MRVHCVLRYACPGTDSSCDRVGSIVCILIHVYAYNKKTEISTLLDNERYLTEIPTILSAAYLTKLFSEVIVKVFSSNFAQ